MATGPIPTVAEFDEMTRPPPKENPFPTRGVPAPYCGVAGFMSREDVMAVAGDAYTIAPFGNAAYANRQLAIGVLVGWNSLNGQPSRQPRRYPTIERVREIIDAAAEDVIWSDTTTFSLKTRCLRIIHYNTAEPNLLAQLDRLAELGGPNLDGFQLNLVWPPSSDIRIWAEENPSKRIIFQVNAKMFDELGRDPEALAARIDLNYVPWITDVLFDMSGGTGKAADLDEASRVLEVLYARLGRHANIGLAGGLEWAAPPVKPSEARGCSVTDLGPLFERWPNLSTDLEGRVRDPSSNAPDPEKARRDGEDDLNPEKAREAVRRQFSVMPRHTP